MDIIKLEKHEVTKALPLFRDIPLGWDVMVDAAKDFGFFLADDRDDPNVAMAFIGGCTVYGGDASHPKAQALVLAMPVQPAILPYPPEWAALVRKVYAEKVQFEQRFSLPFSSLKTNRLPAQALPSGFTLKKIDLSIARRLQAETGEEYHLRHYSSLEDFVDRGCGHCICRGQEVCAAAIAAIPAAGAIQIQINTKEQYRRRGLATQAGAALLRYCVTNGIRAHWDAANLLSKELALKLGYSQCIPYQTLSIFTHN